ncbi:hypothetical protein A9239_15350 [Methanosarcina sp. A14]|uniref:Uncharacterized protein n=1 Tax=Methanosarcina barkeri CM1 TaxID=796385 RepID=A0A0G3CE35_METBA|nr:hypothetical protein MCM1_1125 [Methanosarcina barkeri CM1]OED00502.1 hypothetical protein A9239_15350 [Methanosarcina sp. A14]
MIRNLIDCSEYRIQRSNFEFWDQLIKKELDLLNLHDFLSKYSEGATYHIVFSNPDINKETEVFLPLIN